MGLCIPSIYRHTQSVASDTWVITHNLGSNGSQGIPIVDIFIDDGSGAIVKIIAAGVEMTSANVVTVTFAEPRAGEAVIIV
jgi:hypothetical protein